MHGVVAEDDWNVKIQVEDKFAPQLSRGWVYGHANEHKSSGKAPRLNHVPVLLEVHCKYKAMENGQANCTASGQRMASSKGHIHLHFLVCGYACHVFE